MATVKAIKYGMKGDDVSNLQTSLKNAGYNIDVDGSFGPQTLAAVKDYQQKNGLTVDGMVGPQTQSKLFGGTPASTPANTAPTSGGASNNTSGATSGTNATSGSAASPSTKIQMPDAPAYEAYNAPDYAESDTVLQAQAALNAILAAQPGAYESKWQGQINEMIDRILNREKFTYDINSDALYQQYADQYKNLGKLAMQDTMGQAAAMTGGYGNSYAQSVGQQAYQGYLSQLNEMVPELYGMALDQYNREGQEMYNQYGLLSDQEAQDYGRYRDAYNNWLSDRDYATGRYDSERNFDYVKYIDDRNFGYQLHTDEQERAWNEYVTAIQNAQWGAQFDETVKQNEIGNQQWQQSFDENVKQNAIGNQQWEKEWGAKEEQREIDNAYRAEERARDDVNSIIAGGGTPTDEQLAAAGMSREVAEAMAAISSGSGGSDETIDLVEKMSTGEIVELLESYAAEGNDNAIDTLVEDWYLTGRITEGQMQQMKNKYKKKTNNAPIDTTVGALSGGQNIIKN